MIVNCSLNERRYAIQQLQYKHLDMDDGIKYLGYHLKPNNHRIADWTWLIAKIERRINKWQQRWLSQAGRLVLIKSVL